MYATNNQKNQILCSFIVPIYKGKNMVANIVEMIQKNIGFYLKKATSAYFELILVNDYSEEKIAYSSEMDDLSIIVINNDTNKGIHFSRVIGFENSHGEYVTFLDQDDKIAESFLADQINVINGTNLAVCNGIDYGIPIYSCKSEMDKVNDVTKYLDGVNMILSPGQVLLRRDIVPKEWRSNIVIHNGSDDYFLWSLLVFKGSQFAINSKIEFMHTQSAVNASKNYIEMQESAYEVFDIMTNLHIADGEELKKRLSSNSLGMCLYRDKTQEYYENMKLLNAWIYHKNNGVSLVGYLKHIGIKSVVIYGYGMLGKRLLEEFQAENFSISSVMDRSYKTISIDNLDVLPPGTKLGDVDAIIVTVSRDYHKIVDELSKLYDCKIISLYDLLFNVIPWEKYA